MATTDELKSGRYWRSHKKGEFYAFIDCLKEGDDLLLNDRKRTLTIDNIRTRCEKLGTNKLFTLSGNGRMYTLEVCEQEDTALLRYSQQEEIESIQVVGRNPANITAYDDMRSEEVESVTPPQGVSYHDWEWEANGMELRTVKIALDIMIASEQFRGNTDVNYYRDWRALREEIRGFESFTFCGRERGIVGAALDYAVENTRKAYNPNDEMKRKINELRGAA